MGIPDVPISGPRRRSYFLNVGSEMGHAAFRLFATAAFALYLVIAHAVGHITDLRNAVVGVAAYFFFAALWIAIIGFSVLTFKARRTLSIVVDQVGFAFALYHGGEVLAPVVWAPVLMAVGNGLRNGPAFARLSSLVGGVSVAVALWLTPHWHADRLVSEGLVLSIIILPWYTVMLSEQIASAKREMQLRAARFESASRTDSLTGILNRSGYFHSLQKLLEDVRDNGARSAVMLLDLDGFKAVNDACGHGVGDDVLIEVANRLRDGLRASDTVARIGGDEFGVLVTGIAGVDDVERIAQSFIDAVSHIAVPGHPQLRLGVSVGVCLLSDHDFLDEGAIMETADRLMYQAKKAGKNQYKIDSPLERLRAVTIQPLSA
ncbi:MAG TPA: GGDEF domain-containing protein [Noviherbaspirillum sp.]